MGAGIYGCCSINNIYAYKYCFRGVTLILSGGHISLVVAFKGPNVILGLYTCNSSLTVKRELSAAAG